MRMIMAPDISVRTLVLECIPTLTDSLLYLGLFLVTGGSFGCIPSILAYVRIIS
jgi:hypothetical protein